VPDVNSPALRVAALGGGHGLPVVLRAFKPYTTEMSAIVSVADDGGSSGLLRDEMGVLPPGDLRNNIAALADDEALMTQLFQYRFGTGSLEGHSLGNLLLTALVNITGSMDRALAAAGHVLAIRGQVLPATLQNVRLIGERRTEAGLTRIVGESNIPKGNGTIDRVYLEPDGVRAFPPAIQAILNAQLIVVGPGSLYTSLLPVLLIPEIAQAIRATSAPCVYVCNVATQRGETDDFTVADHLAALDSHLGADLIDIILCNDTFPPLGEHRVHTQYVTFDETDRQRLAGRPIVACDLTDALTPWRHDPRKLSAALRQVIDHAPMPIGDHAH